MKQEGRQRETAGSTAECRTGGGRVRGAFRAREQNNMGEMETQEGGSEGRAWVELLPWSNGGEGGIGEQIIWG